MTTTDSNASPAEHVPTLGMAAYRAPSLLQPHRAREALADAHAGKIPPLIGYFCGLSSVAISRIAAQLGFDAVAIDWEHAAMSVETMTQMVHDIQFMSEGRTMAFVRVPGHDHHLLSFALDAGASIIVPQVNTVEEARAVASYTKFGKSLNGTRSAAPCRLIPGISDRPIDPSTTPQQNVNRQAAVIIQIESLEGIQNLDAILTEVGSDIDSVWLGSFDARVSMEVKGGGLWGNEKEWQDAARLYEGTLRKHNKPASGLALGDPETVKKMARGRSFVVTSSDFYSLVFPALQDLAASRATLAKQDYSEVYDSL
ncbi:Pyruvate/Phosphoenolpyruvate kinase-like domain-containing protein [Bisporella sp. PMI_857]|nr:Pyruvate/Phosphoenolpyruvate kinase-like domain-containing protein [Bisporella sp. PMI_857]